MPDSDNNPVTVEWVKKHLGLLQRDANDIFEVTPDTVNDFRPWSALKLIVLAGVVEFYTRIIPNSGYENMFYVDMMAGSGAVEIDRGDREGEVFVGSPILAAAMAHQQFDRMFLVERDAEKADALEERIRFAAESLEYGFDADQVSVYTADANDAVNKITSEIARTAAKTSSVHTLAFVDNEGANIRWPAMESLARVHSDIVVNFPGNSIQRLAGNDYRDRLTRFYGDERWRAAGTKGDELRAIYKGNLAAEGRPVQEHVRVDGDKSFYYDVVYAARETSSGNQYMVALEYLRDQLEPLDGDDVDRVIGYMKGEPTDFDPFPGPDPDQANLMGFD